jgi:F-type H+-transporting ATPase subunit a
MNPMEQFAIKPLVEAPLFQIGGHAIHFTNQAAMMVLVAVVASVFLSLAAKPGRLVPTRG